jgi:hypothetical protein
MAQQVTLMMASRGCSILGIGDLVAADVLWVVPDQRLHRDLSFQIPRVDPPADALQRSTRGAAPTFMNRSPEGWFRDSEDFVVRPGQATAPNVPPRPALPFFYPPWHIRVSDLGARVARGAGGRRLFRLVLVKPSHYDDDGYVIQWFRSPIPANSLACLYGLARHAKEQDALGSDVELDIVAIDETNTRIRPDKIARQIEEADVGLVMLVGVQSNQFPRALDIATPLRAGGSRSASAVSTSRARSRCCPRIEENVQRALDMGCFMFAGEAEEGRLELVLKDAIAGELKPIYNFMKDLPGIDRVPTPHLPRPWSSAPTARTPASTPAAAVPFQCSFCTIINVQGRKSRRRSADDVERIVRENAAQGILRFFITDDNFARNKDWEIIFDRLIHLREVEKIKIRLIIQVDTLCHKIPNFIEKSARAGVRRVFIGLENVSPDNLAAAKKKQNKITEYRKMLLAWKQAGVLTYAGYILGFRTIRPSASAATSG